MDRKIETKCVQAGWTPNNGAPRQDPIYQVPNSKDGSSADLGG